MTRWYRGGTWTVPLAWTFLALAMVRLGHVTVGEGLPPVLLALVGTGGFRALAGNRGGVAGLAAELVLAGSAVAWLLAEPADHRLLVSLAGTSVSCGLALLGVWPAADAPVRRRLAAAAGMAAGIVTATGLTGAPSWELKAALLVCSATVTGWLLAGVAAPALAIATTVALAAAIGPEHASAWLLPPVMAGALLALQHQRGWIAGSLAVVAAALPPAGLAAAAGILVAAIRRARSPGPALLAGPALLLAWWRLPAGVPLVNLPQLDSLASALPLAADALPLLAPLLVLGLLSRPGAAAEARDLLGTGLLVLPFVARGDWLPAVSACLWLAALPAAATASEARLQRAISATLPWTVGIAAALLLLSPWGGAGLVPVRPLLLVCGWTAALLLSLLPFRAARLAWVLPAAGLLWTLPVEGIDRHLAPGETLPLPAAPQGWVLAVDPGTSSPFAPQDGVLEPVAVRDPWGWMPAQDRLTCPGGRGRQTVVSQRSVGRWHSAASQVRASTHLVVRTEEASAWLDRRRRLLLLLGGSLLLLLAAHLPARTLPLPLDCATAILLAATVAAGCSVAPLARPAARDAPDVALAVLLGCWLALLPQLRRRRFVAGALLLLPLALAQPLLRGPAGDEVYHLQLLQSLAEDHDLAISNNIDPHDPAEAIYLRHGDDLVHSPLLAFLVLPGFLLLGHAGALVITALLVAAGAALVAGRCHRLGPGRAAGRAWLATLLSYPALTFSTQLWPGSIAIFLVGLLLVLVERQGASDPARPWPAVVAFLAMVVKVRLALVTVPVALAAVLRRRDTRRLPALVMTGIMAAAAAALLALLLGSPIGRHQLWELRWADLLQPLAHCWGLLWDGAGGLAFAAPLWLVALTALPAVWRRGGAGERGLLVGAVLTVTALAPRGEWYGGGSPPARYLVPLLPLAQLALALAWSRHRGRRVIRLLLPWTAVAAWVAATRPLWLYNPVDSGWWLADGLARSLGVAARSCFPTLLRPETATVAVPLLALTTALWWAAGPRRQGAAAVTITALGLLLVFTSVWREGHVHAEDPQVHHADGIAEPPPGKFFRARRGISWRLPPGGTLELPWTPPAAVGLRARVRIDLPAGAKAEGRLRSSWRGGSTAQSKVRSGYWRGVRLAPPAGLGRGHLRLQWLPAADGPVADLLVDQVYAVRQRPR